MTEVSIRLKGRGRQQKLTFLTVPLPTEVLGSGTATGTKYLRDDGIWQAPQAEHPSLAAHDTLGLATQSELDAHAAAADPHTGYQKESEKGAVSGYASLGQTSLVPQAQLGSGTPDGTKYLRDDGSWQAPTAAHPDLAAHDTLGLATQAELDTHAGAADPHAVYQLETGLPLAAWPVGSVFIAVVSTNPNTLLGGGTWAAIGAGRVLVGLDSGDTDFDTVEETGGAKTVAVSAQAFAGTPSTAIVNHVHVQNLPTSQTGGQNSGTRDTSTTGSGADALSTANPTGGVASYTPVGTNTPGAATSVVQPYFVCYFWKRTA